MARIAVATQQGGLDDQISQVFGRCQTYTFVDIEGDEIKDSEVEQNQYTNATSGAGIQAAGFVANQGAEAVISGNFGPNIVSVLNKSGVKMITASGMKVRDAVQKYLDGELQAVTQATNPAMSGSKGGSGGGMGRQTTQQQAGQSPPSQPDQQTRDDRIQNLENKMENLEDQLGDIQNALEDLSNQE